MSVDVWYGAGYGGKFVTTLEHALSLMSEEAMVAWDRDGVEIPTNAEIYVGLHGNGGGCVVVFVKGVLCWRRDFRGGRWLP